MIKKKLTIYVSDCGKKFFNKKECLQHEDECKCLSNPSLKTCKSCKYGSFKSLLTSPRIWRCSNPDFVFEKHFNSIPEDKTYLCINCKVWNSRKEPLYLDL